MTNKKNVILMWILALIPLISVAILYGKLPAEVPMHWGVDGTVGYGPKYQLFIIGGLSLFMAAMFQFMPKIDPRKNNYGKFGKYYDLFCIFMELFLMIVMGIVLSESLYPGKISVGHIVPLFCSILFIFLGNIMPKIKNNFFFGFKTPWTLSDPDVWNKTHRLSGILMFITGFITLIGTFILPQEALFVVMMSLIVIATLIPGVMSYIWYKRTHRKEE